MHLHDVSCCSFCFKSNLLFETVALFHLSGRARCEAAQYLKPSFCHRSSTSLYIRSETVQLCAAGSGLKFNPALARSEVPLMPRYQKNGTESMSKRVNCLNRHRLPIVNYFHCYGLTASCTFVSFRWRVRDLILHLPKTLLP